MIAKNQVRGNLLVATAASAIVLGLASPASAVVVGPIDTGGYTGSVSFHFTGYSVETTSGPYGTPGVTQETTIAAGFIDNAFQSGNPGNIFYSPIGPTTDRIGFFVYGIADGNIRGTAPDFSIYNIGCSGGVGCDGLIHADLYLLPHSASTNFITDLVPSDRVAFDQFIGITDAGSGASLFMSWIFTPGYEPVDLPNNGTDTNPGFDESTTTLKQTASAATLPATGQGNWYAACVGGPACAYFNTNGFPASIGADFFGQFDLDTNLLGANPAWGGRISDPIQTFIQEVPEPGTLAILGTGLLGLLGLGRRRRRRS